MTTPTPESEAFAVPEGDAGPTSPDEEMVLAEEFGESNTDGIYGAGVSE